MSAPVATTMTIPTVTAVSPTRAKVKIKLPQFSGDRVKWTSFWYSYKSAIHLNGDLSKVDKFNYLCSLLDSTAYDAISGPNYT